MERSYDFVIADVFTEHRFGGNQLAVLTDATGLSSEQMQRIAREFNFSETTFVLAAEGPGNARRVRIFTPAVELPFAGHPTVGTTAVLADLGVIAVGSRAVLEVGIGPVGVEVAHRDGQRIVSSVVLERAAEVRESEPTHADAAAVLSLRQDDVVDAFSASVGVPFSFVHLRDRDAVERASLNREVWAKGLAHGWGRDLYFFEGDLSPGGRIYARMFGPGVGMAEDAATGAACAALVGVLGERESRADGRVTLTVDQGHGLGRPSVIEATATVEGGRVVRLGIGGSTVMVARGSIVA